MPQPKKLTSLRKLIPRLTVTLLLVASTSSSVFGQHQGDRLVLFGFGETTEAALPRGEFGNATALQDSPLAMAYGPDNNLYILRPRSDSPPFNGPFISRVDGDGQVSDLMEIPVQGGEDPIDLAFGFDGRLYVLTFGQTIIAPPDIFQRVLTLESGTFELITAHFIPFSFDNFRIFDSIAPSRDGLWLLAADQLLEFEPESETFDEMEVDLLGLGVPVAADTDSTGALWILTEPGFADPPLFSFKRLDPATGSLQTAHLAEKTTPGPMAIHRRCQANATGRCLQGGRFAASVTWRDFEGNSDQGTAAANGSTDSALFWFFDAANWELLVKVLDGCDNNGNFWVFAGATTDVEFNLRVADLETGQVFEVDNPLGNPPLTVNATGAFPTCP